MQTSLALALALALLSILSFVSAEIALPNCGMAPPSLPNPINQITIKNPGSVENNTPFFIHGDGVEATWIVSPRPTFEKVWFRQGRENVPKELSSDLAFLIIGSVYYSTASLQKDIQGPVLVCPQQQPDPSTNGTVVAAFNGLGGLLWKTTLPNPVANVLFSFNLFP